MRREYFPSRRMVAKGVSDATVSEDRAARRWTSAGWLITRITVPGIRFATPLVVLHLDELAPCTPHLPHRQLGTLMQLAASAALHVTLVLIVALVTTTLAPGIELRRATPTADQHVRHLVFIAPEMPRIGSGGAGVVIGSRPRYVGRRASAPMQSPNACENRRRHRRRRPPFHVPPRTLRRSHRSCSMRSRWPPGLSIRLECRQSARCQARRQVQGRGAASAMEAGPVWARDVAPDSAPVPAVALAAAFTALAGQYPRRV